MKKIYQKPEIQTVKLNVELPMASSLNMSKDHAVGGSHALSNQEGKIDIWNNEQNVLW